MILLTGQDDDTIDRLLSRPRIVDGLIYLLTLPAAAVVDSQPVGASVSSAGNIIWTGSPRPSPAFSQGDVFEGYVTYLTD